MYFVLRAPSILLIYILNSRFWASASQPWQITLGRTADAHFDFAKATTLGRPKNFAKFSILNPTGRVG